MKTQYKNLAVVLIFLSVTFGFSCYTPADVDWWQYIASSDEYSFYYDNSAVSYSTSCVAVWVKAVPRVRLQIDGKYVSFVLKHWAFYSGERKFKELATEYHFGSDILKHSGGEKKNVNPGTIVDELYERFCSN